MYFVGLDPKFSQVSPQISQISFRRYDEGKAIIIFGLFGGLFGN